MKKTVLILSLALAALPLKAYDFKETFDGQTLYYNIIDAEAHTCEVTYGDTPYTDETIYIYDYASNYDDTYNYIIIGIGDNAFKGCADVFTVKVPITLEYIGKDAFKGSNLQWFAIPPTVTSISDRAFADCKNLIYVKGETDIPANIKLGENVFENVDFANCMLLTPRGALKDYLACPQWDQFSELNYESPYHFVEYGIPYAIIDSEAMTCEAQANDDKITLWNYCIPSKVEHNGKTYTVVGIDGSFNNPEIYTVDLPLTLEYIGSGTFYGSNISDIGIPESVTKIGFNAFSNCKSLEYIYSYNRDPKKIEFGENVFEGIDVSKCTLYVPIGCVEDYESTPGWNYFSDIRNDKYHIFLNEIFYRITDPDFYYCAAVDYRTIRPWIYFELFDVSETLEIQQELEFEGKPYTVNRICEWTFEDAPYRNIILPPTIEEIEKSAFSNAWIETVNIPASVKEIGNGAFEFCEDLKSITCEVPDPADIELGRGIFWYVDYDNCDLWVPKGSADLYRAADQWKEFYRIKEYDTGIDDVAIDDADSTADCPAVYYNLNGAPVPAADLAPGLYIRRQGTTATKVIIR